jgi:ABC-type uncharacterized transport system fused permease/ATPase subunit
MEDNPNLVESLLEKATDYGKTSFELAKLKALDKTSEVSSVLMLNSVVLVLVVSFLLFVNLGLAFWLGELLGKIYYGFFVIALFYCTVATIIHLFLQKWFKKLFANYIIKQVLK